MYKDPNVWVNTKKIFLEAVVYAENCKGTTPVALKQTDFVSAPNPFGLYYFFSPRDTQLYTLSCQTTSLSVTSVTSSIYETEPLTLSIH